MKNLFKLDSNPSRIYGLDILRTVAIMLVVFLHGEYFMPQSYLKYLRPFKFDGVTLFFVLSGFLIGSILMKLINNGPFNFKTIANFWIRRWFRTLPNYFLLLFILLILYEFHDENFSFLHYGRYLIFAQNLYYEQPYFFAESWSLTVEEWFYLILPIFIFIASKIINLSTNRALIYSAIFIIIGATIFRFYRYNTLTYYHVDLIDVSIRKQVIPRLDSLMYGVLGAYFYIQKRQFWIKYKLPFFLLGILLFVAIKINGYLHFSSIMYDSVFSFTTMSVATLFLLPYLSMLEKGSGIVYKGVTFISLISYSMYLTNYSLVRYGIIGHLNWQPLQNYNMQMMYVIRYLSYWFLTIILSYLIYKYFEVPMMKLRDRIKIK